MFNFLRITNRKENYGSVLAFHSSQWHHPWSLRGGRERRRSVRRTEGNPRVHAFSAARSVPFATEMEARLAFSQPACHCSRPSLLPFSAAFPSSTSSTPDSTPPFISHWNRNISTLPRSLVDENFIRNITSARFFLWNTSNNKAEMSQDECINQL